MHLDDVGGVEGPGQGVPHLLQPLLQLSGLVLQIGDPEHESILVHLQSNRK